MTEKHPSPGIGEYGLFPFCTEKSFRYPAAWWCVCMLLSVFLYLAVFSTIQKPYSIGVYNDLISAKLERLQSINGNKIIIIGGSNARISHQAKLLEKELGIAAVNGGLTADLSLRFLINLYEPHMHRGDFIYMPLEYELLSSNNNSSRSELHYLAIYGDRMLENYSPLERAIIRFTFDLGDLLSEPVERYAARSHVNRRSEMNAWGDQTGYTAEAAESFRSKLMKENPMPVPSISILEDKPNGVRVLCEFLQRCSTRDVHVIGGLPTTIRERSIDLSVVDYIASMYTQHDHRFVRLSNLSQYTRESFFDTQYHLIDKAAEIHTHSVASTLGPVIGEHRR